MKEESFQTQGNPLTSGSVWSFGISEGNITSRKKKKKTENTLLTATPSGEVAQKLLSAPSEQGLNRETRVACLG